MKQLSAFIEGVGVLGPGLDNWPQAIDILSRKTPYAPQRTVLPPTRRPARGGTGDAPDRSSSSHWQWDMKRLAQVAAIRPCSPPCSPRPVATGQKLPCDLRNPRWR